LKNNIEKNLLKTILFIYIAISSSMILAISFFYVKNTQDNFEKQLLKYKSDYYIEIENSLKMKITMVMDILDYNIKNLNLSQDEIKKYTINFLNNLTFEENSSNYIFVYEVLNFEGGDNFAKMLVNPNRPDLFGKDISTNEEDGNGKKFREEFLENIKKYGESYTRYSYKKPDSKALQYKLSYFKYYPHFNWIIAAGVYIDDIENELNLKKDELKEEIRKQIIQNIILFVIFLIIAIITLALISNKIYKILKNYKKQVIENEKELKVLNKSLEEMISNIAHQWRQPLGSITMIIQSFQTKMHLGKLTEKFVDEKVNDALLLASNMSSTLEDFKNFFSPNKTKSEFFIKNCLEHSVELSKYFLNKEHIHVILKVKKDVKLNSYYNELSHVFLNIISN